MIYTVMMEINGNPVKIGHIRDGCFSYDTPYLSSQRAHAVSLSLPLREEPFSVLQTKYFFDGLLPEGFTRRTVAQWMHVNEDDYLSILAGLGRECLGAIQILDDKAPDEPHYNILSLSDVRALAAEGTRKSAEIVTKSHLSLTGASGKVGLYYDKKHNVWYQPLGTAPSTHIVKQSHVRYSGMVVNELLCLQTAQKCGISVPHSFIVSVGNAKDDSVLFATQRYDRLMSSDGPTIDGLSCPKRLHQEDFCQALGYSSAEKYESSTSSHFKDAFTLLRNFSTNPLEDQLKLWDLTVFNFLVGNTDNHMKNMSLLYDHSLSVLRLAPAYDIVSTTVYAESTHNLSLRIGNAMHLEEVSMEAFRQASHEVGLGEKMAMERLYLMLNQFERALNTTAEELQKQGFMNAKNLRDQILSSGGYGYLSRYI